MSEFSDRPFVMGSLRGLRSFRVDALGRLTGVSFREVWTPNENVAACKRGMPTTGTFSLFGSSFYSQIFDYNFLTGKPTAETDEERLERVAKEAARLEALRADVNHISTLGCECGFYAYFDEGSNPYHTKGETIRGVIEAYGRITVGSRGFRAQKAAVVALIEPGKRAAQSAALASTLPLVRRNYPDIKFYGSTAEALADFPLVAPPVPSPEDTDDFWTRSAS